MPFFSIALKLTQGFLMVSPCSLSQFQENRIDSFWDIRLINWNFVRMRTLSDRVQRSEIFWNHLRYNLRSHSNIPEYRIETVWAVRVANETPLGGYEASMSCIAFKLIWEDLWNNPSSPAKFLKYWIYLFQNILRMYIFRIYNVHFLRNASLCFQWCVSQKMHVPLYKFSSSYPWHITRSRLKLILKSLNPNHNAPN